MYFKVSTLVMVMMVVKVMLKVLTWSSKVVIVSQTVVGHVQLSVNCFILAADAMSPKKHKSYVVSYQQKPASILDFTILFRFKIKHKKMLIFTSEVLKIFS